MLPNDAKGQIGADVLLSVTPPPQMPATLEAGTIAGYSVGEPWNQAAVFKGIGRPVVTDEQIFREQPGKGLRPDGGLRRRPTPTPRSRSPRR